MIYEYDVSVIIPAYNVELYIEECIDSVLRQTKENVEIIIVDDGSTDNTTEICNIYADKHENINFIRNDNAGQGAARNYGIKIARGEFIYLLDSDDYIESNALEALYEVAKLHSAEIVMFNGVSFIDNKDVINDSIYMKKNIYPETIEGTIAFDTLSLNNEYTCSPCLLFIKASMLKKNNILFEENIIQEDEIFTFDLLIAAKRVYISPLTLFHRRIRPGSTTQSSNYSKKFLGYHRVVMKMSDDSAIKEFEGIRNHFVTMVSNTIYYYSKMDKQSKKLHKTKINEIIKLLKIEKFYKRLDFKLFALSPNAYRILRKLNDNWILSD